MPRSQSVRGSGSALQGQWPFAAAVLALGSVALIALFWTTALSAVDAWQASNLYSHGFLIIPVCGYLLWRRRAALARLAPSPSFWGIAVIGLMAFAWAIGHATATAVVQQFALVGMIQAFLLTVLGLEVVSAIAFPLFYLYFAVPFGSFLIPPLQEFTAEFLVSSLQLTGVPVHLDGLLIHLPSISFHVAEACAGARFLLSSVAIGFLVANLFYRSWKRRFLFVALSIVVPIIGNGLRAYGIVMIAHLRDFKSAATFDHVTYGLVFLGFVTLCLLALGWTFRERTRTRPPAQLSSTNTKPASFARSFQGLSLAGAGALLVAAAPLAMGLGSQPDVSVRKAVALSAPGVREPWRQTTANGRHWRPVFHGADAEVQQTYRADGREVDLYLAYYAHESQGAEVINEENSPAGGTNWKTVGGGKTDITVEANPLTVSCARIASGSKRRLVCYWYWVDGRFTSSRYMAKLLQAKVRILGGIDAASAIAVAADYTDEPAEAIGLLQGFLAHADPISDLLARAAKSHSSVSRRPGRVVSQRHLPG